MAAIREPAVAGRFYPGDARELDEQVARLIGDASGSREALAVVVPHAGYAYSGALAGATYHKVAVPPSVVVLCPNHTGVPPRIALWAHGSWRLPGAQVGVDERLAQAIAQAWGISHAEAPHVREHAIEVQLPFLRARQAQVRVVPVCMGEASYEECQLLGDRLATLLRGWNPGGRPPLLVASTDMSHYLPARVAREQDALVLERLLALDPQGLHSTVTTRRLSMCGFVPTTVVLAAARCLGASAAELTAYGHSGEVTGDDSAVVGYAGAVIR